MERKSLEDIGNFGLFATSEEIGRYRNISTAQKLKWLDDMRHLVFATLTGKDIKKWERLRKAGL